MIIITIIIKIKIKEHLILFCLKVLIATIDGHGQILKWILRWLVNNEATLVHNHPQEVKKREMLRSWHFYNTCTTNLKWDVVIGCYWCAKKLVVGSNYDQ